MAQMIKKLEVQQALITQWKKQLLLNAGTAFDKSEKATEDIGKTVKELHAKIVQLNMKNDFFERELERIHRPRGMKW